MHDASKKLEINHPYDIPHQKTTDRPILYYQLLVHKEGHRDRACACCALIAVEICFICDTFPFLQQVRAKELISQIRGEKTKAFFFFFEPGLELMS